MYKHLLSNVFQYESTVNIIIIISAFISVLGTLADIIHFYRSQTIIISHGFNLYDATQASLEHIH